MRRLALLIFAAVGISFAQGNWNGGQITGGQLGATTSVINVGSFAQLPLKWLDNNAAYDGVNCGGFCVGLGYNPPAYELRLGASAATWVVGPPACTGVFQALSVYQSTAVGKQAAINDVEACRTYGIAHGNVQYCTQIDVPPASTQAAYSGQGAVRAGAYWSPAGVTIQQTSNVMGSCFNDVRSTQHAALAALPEPVCWGGIQDNLPTSTAPGLVNSDCTGTNMHYELGPKNVGGVITGFTTLSSNTTTLTAVTSTGVQLVGLAHGYVAPGPGYIVDTGGNQETVVGISGMNQIGLYGNFTKTHAAGVPVTYNVGAFTLANGTATNTANYNYLQYMYEDVCTSFANCFAMQFCGVTSTTSLPCAGTAMGPDHWMFEDGAAAMSAGNPGSNTVVNTGTGGSTLLSFSQLPNNLHFRRYWAHGDWTSLATGTNSVTNGFQLSCLGCSLVGTTVSEVLRPGGEGHNILVPGTFVKMTNDVFDGSSTCIFSGGLSFNPFIGFVPFQDVQIGRVRCTYPYQWLGSHSVGNCPANQSCATIPNNNPYWGGASAPWVSAPTMAYISGSTLFWASGDSFHDSTSVWGNNTVTVNGLDYKLAGSGVWTQTCGAFCYPANPPTQIPLLACTGAKCGTLPCVASCGTSGSPLTFTMTPFSDVRKNGNEMKEGHRIVIYGSYFENVDQSGGQNGTVNTINVRNHSGGGFGQNYYAVITDLTIEKSILRNACWGMELAARSASFSGEGGGVSYPMRALTLSNMLQYNIAGSNPGCPGTHGGMSMASGGQTWTGTLTENAAGTQATFVGNYSVEAAAPVSQSAITATCVGTGCSPAIAANTLQVTAANNFVANENVEFQNTAESFLNNTAQAFTVSATGLSGTQFQVPLTRAAYSNPSDTGTVGGPVGFEVMNISAGDGVFVTGCTSVASFNMPTHVLQGQIVALGIGPGAAVGSTPWTGTQNAGNMTVTYPWTATPGTSVDNSGTCVITNMQGNPQNVAVQHMTFVTDATDSFGGGNQPKGGPNFQANHLFQDSIVMNGVGAACTAGTSCGWYNSSVGEGTPTETFNYDPTTMTADHLAWVGRPSSRYTFYGNNPIVPVAAPTMFFPARPYCDGATVAGSTFTCVAFVGGMSLAAMPLTLPDYHSFALRSDSTLHAGNAQQASDGTDMGANIPLIDASQTQSTYVCASACGTPGPFPD